MTNKLYFYDKPFTHPQTYDAIDENNESYLFECQDEDCNDQFGDNDF